MTTIYGIKSCDTCRKARAALPEAAVVDLRTDAALATLVPQWHAAVGDALLNKASTTWRQLSDADKARAASDLPALLVANPTLIKRPVIDRDGEVTIGWSKAVQAEIGG